MCIPENNRRYVSPITLSKINQMSINEYLVMLDDFNEHNLRQRNSRNKTI